MSIIRSYPERLAGISLTTPASAWGYSPYVRIVDEVNKDIKLFGFSFQVTNIPAADATHDILFEIALGNQGYEVLKVQVPYSNRADTVVGYYMIRQLNIFLPEPIDILRAKRISMRAADSLSSSIVYSAVKILYSSSIPLVPQHDVNNFKFSSGRGNFTEGWQ